jgi:hypothetical protein
VEFRRRQIDGEEARGKKVMSISKKNQNYKGNRKKIEHYPPVDSVKRSRKA